MPFHGFKLRIQKPIYIGLIKKKQTWDYLPSLISNFSKIYFSHMMTSTFEEVFRLIYLVNVLAWTEEVIYHKIQGFN